MATIPEDSVTVMALLHDICKTHFYGTSTRNQKNDVTGKWEKVPYYTVEDKMPLGHGPKSAMIIKQYTTLTTMEMYAIWHHMGQTGDYENDNAVGKSMEMYPAVLALHTADMMASRFMEGEKENKPPFDGQPPEASSGAASAREYADNPTTGEPAFEDAPPLIDPVWCSCRTMDGADGFWCLCDKGIITAPSGQSFSVDEIPDWKLYPNRTEVTP